MTEYSSCLKQQVKVVFVCCDDASIYKPVFIDRPS